MSVRKVTNPPGGRPSGSADAPLPQAARFLAAGGLATACHYALLVVLVEAGLLGPTPASAAGYAAAAVLNYHLRRRLVFRSRRPHRRLLPGYLAVMAGGFGLNAAVMALGTGPLALPYPVAQVVATGLVLAWNFAAHRLWTFRAAAAAPPADAGVAGLPGGPPGR